MKFFKTILMALTSFVFALTLIIVPQNSHAQTYRKNKNQVIKQELKNRRKMADRNLNGHYISLGSSLLSSGYYGGVAGVGYEYRYRAFGFNLGGGYGLERSFFIANAGVRFYFANQTKFVRNFYLNVLPVSYFGQGEEYKTDYTLRNNTVIKIEEHKYPHLLGLGLFLGYCPVWHVGKKVSLGFNIDVGIKTDYKFQLNPNGFPINWDLGLILKFDGKRKYKKHNSWCY